MPEVTIAGTVTPFKGNGRKLGYPTANLAVPTDLNDGVYFGYADLNDYENHPAMIFIGTPETMGDTERRVEVHLLDIPDKDYYGEKLTARVQHFHRSNQKFNSLEELKEAMADDERTALAWFDKSS